MGTKFGQYAAILGIGAAMGLGACVAEGEELGTSQQEVSALLMGNPLAYEHRAGGFISEVLVEVKKGWVNSEAFELEIEITGVNDGFLHHGIQLVPLNTTTTFDTDKDTARVVVDWTADTEAQHIGEIYTICVQVLTDGNPLGDIKCDDFD